MKALLLLLILCGAQCWISSAVPTEEKKSVELLGSPPNGNHWMLESKHLTDNTVEDEKELAETKIPSENIMEDHKKASDPKDLFQDIIDNPTIPKHFVMKIIGKDSKSSEQPNHLTKEDPDANSKPSYPKSEVKLNSLSKLYDTIFNAFGFGTRPSPTIDGDGFELSNENLNMDGDLAPKNGKQATRVGINVVGDNMEQAIDKASKILGDMKNEIQKDDTKIVNDNSPKVRHIRNFNPWERKQQTAVSKNLNDARNTETMKENNNQPKKISLPCLLKRIGILEENVETLSVVVLIVLCVMIVSGIIGLVCLFSIKPKPKSILPFKVAGDAGGAKASRVYV